MIEKFSILPEDQQRIILMAGMANLLAEVSVYLSPTGREEHQEMIDECLTDWCKLTGWKCEATLNHRELIPPGE